MVQVYLIAALILAGLVATFAVQNNAAVEVQFVVWKFQSSLVIIIFLAAVVGAFAATLVSLPQAVRAWARLRQREGEVARLEDQVRRLEERVAAGAEVARDRPAE